MTERARYHGPVRWLVDGYNVIRRSPELASRERESLEAARAALCRLLAEAARVAGDEFTVVFDGEGRGGGGLGAPGVRVLFSSARESADRVIVRLASRAGAVVSNDREVRRGAARAGAVAVSADHFLARLESARGRCADAAAGAGRDDEEPRPTVKKGNPRRLGKKARAQARALRRLGPEPPKP